MPLLFRQLSRKPAGRQPIAPSLLDEAGQAISEGLRKRPAFSVLPPGGAESKHANFYPARKAKKKLDYNITIYSERLLC
jgi:hypothetical protein